MTETFQTNTTETDPQVLIETFFKTFTAFTEEEKAKIEEAWTLLISKTKDLKRYCGKPYYLHPMRVACVLAQSNLDVDTVIAGFFHNITEVDPDSIPQLEEKFGKDVAAIVSGTSRITNLNIHVKDKTLQQADNIRKMLFAMTSDIRVIFVKLADRLDRMRNLRNVSEENQRDTAKEVIDIWAPLASRLGMNDIKNELEDLSLKYSNPDAFQQIKSIVSLKKQERSEFLNTAVKKIYSSAQRAGIEVSITSRAKHFYSIYQKMRKRNKSPGELYDLLALRIICQTETECYTLVGIVHGLWKPLDGRFKDYIAMPKANGYQSLHTTVVCDGMPLEIQIRTEKMHNIAEHGVASHWLYKKGTNHDMVNAGDLSIINQLKSLHEKNLTDEAYFNELKNDLLGDEIFVFTPKGDVIQLPAGSNAVDFAYAIHSGVGEKIVGAKADGKIIPLTAELKNTQIIEVITNPQGHPTQAQLKSVKTTKARQKINQWLTLNDPTFIDKEAVAKKEAENAANIAHSHEVQASLVDGRKKKRKDKPQESLFTGKIRIEGDTNFLMSIAQCCNPQPGDEIVGYVSRNRGITIHRADCMTYLRMPEAELRTVEVSWDQKNQDLKNQD